MPALLVFSVFLALFAFFGVERHAGVSKFCAICASEEQVSFWTIRGTNIRLNSSTQHVDTPFSLLLASRKFVAVHEHKWLEPMEVPDVNNYGAHSMATLGDLNTSRTLGFAQNLFDFGEPWMRDQWLGIVMQPDTAHIIDSSLAYFGMPEKGFAQKIDFQRWIGEHAHQIHERIEVLSGRD